MTLAGIKITHLISPDNNFSGIFTKKDALSGRPLLTCDLNDRILEEADTSLDECA